MSQRRKYRVEISWTHRRWGIRRETITAEGTSIRRGIANALLGFFSDKGPNPQRRDAHAEIAVHATRIKAPAAR